MGQGNYVEGMKKAREEAERETANKIAAWLEMTHRSVSSQHIAAKIRAGLWKKGPFR